MLPVETKRQRVNMLSAVSSQQSGQGSFYDLSRRHEPAEADPIYGAPDLRFKAEGESPEKFV